MTNFADDILLRQARAKFFAEHATTFGKEGGYDAKWIRMEFWPFPIYLPNMSGRDRAVRLHDVHHIIAGYGVDLKGEAEIGAWEVGGGCGNFWHAWVLNMGAMALGVLIAPRRTFRAFLRGRRTDNLYHHYARMDDALLDQTVGELRQRLRLADPIADATWRDAGAFLWWGCLSMIVAASFPALALGLIAVVIIVVLKLMG